MQAVVFLCVKAFFCPFFILFMGKLCFSRQYLSAFFGFFTRTQFSRALFLFFSRPQFFFFFLGQLFEPTQPRCFLFPRIPVLKKMTQLGFFERGPGGGAYLLPILTQPSCSTFFPILKVNMLSTLSLGTLFRPV